MDVATYNLAPRHRWDVPVPDILVLSSSTGPNIRNCGFGSGSLPALDHRTRWAVSGGCMIYFVLILDAALLLTPSWVIIRYVDDCIVSLIVT